MEYKKIYHYANDYKKALQKQQDLVASQEEYQRKVETGGFLDAEDKQKAEDAIKEKQKQAEKAAIYYIILRTNLLNCIEDYA